MEEKKPNVLLRRERELKGWSQKALAERVGTSEQSVNHWETGLHKPNKYFQTQLCQLLGKNAEELGFLDDMVMKLENTEQFLSFHSSSSVRINTQNSPFTIQEKNVDVDLFTIGITALLLHQQQHHWNVNELEQKIIQALDENTPDMQNDQHDMEPQKPGMFSRRDVLLLLSSLPSALLGLEDTSSLLTEEVASLCLMAIPICWRLVYTGGIQHVEKVLPNYLTRVTALVHPSFRYHKLAASLASQGYKLANLLALRHEDFVTALKYSKDAFFYGQLAEDPNLQVAALIEEALTCWYRKRPSQTLTAYKQALSFIKEISPILKARVYVGLGEAYAEFGQEQEALQYMGLAYDTFPDHPENDPNFSYTHYNRYYLYLYEGLLYTKLHQPAKALAAYTHFNVPEYAARSIEIANREAMALLLLEDLDQCCLKVEKAVTLALAGKSDLRYSEAREVYQEMRIKWPREQKVKDLAQLFRW